MKIALIIEHFNPDGGGAEKSTAQIARHLSRRGHRVDVLTWDTWGSASDPGFTVRTCAQRGRLGALRLIRLRQWVRQRLQQDGYDASLSVTTTIPAAIVQPRSGTLAETFERNIAMRRSVFARTLKRVLLATSPKVRTLLALERRTLGDPMVRRFAAVSDYVARQLTQGYGIDPSRIDVIPNAADMPQPAPAERESWRATVRRGFGLADDATVFLFAALNARLKGITTLLAAMAKLQARHLPAWLMIAGDASYALQRQVANVGLRERVRFVGPTRHMAKLYCAADVTVLPTFYDPSSKVVIESLMMGTPAISTAFNGASDFIRAGGGGASPAGRVIDDPADADALADAMVELLDPAVRRHCAQATAGLAEQLAMTRHVDRLETLLGQCPKSKVQSPESGQSPA